VQYGFIKADHRNYRAAKLCDALKMSRSGYSAWDKRPERMRTRRHRELSAVAEKEFYDNKKILGSTKIAQKLSKSEASVNRKTVAAIRRGKGLKSRVVRKYKATTNSNHNLPVAENLWNRDFRATHPNKKWVSDITYISTDEGWLYLAGILDLCGREIVSWSMGNRMTKEVVIGLIKQAFGRRCYPKEVLNHFDRGSQYCSREYQNELKQRGFICSMSRKGNCYDNALMESFWGKLKQE